MDTGVLEGIINDFQSKVEKNEGIIEIEYIIDFIKALQEHEYDAHVVIMGQNGNGKCQIAGDKVLMADGTWKNIEDIKVGDRVFSPNYDGTYTIANVIATHSRFEEEVYDIVEAKRGNRRLYSCAWNHEIPIIGTYRPRPSKDKKAKRPVIRMYKILNARQISKLKTANTSHVVSFTNPAAIEFGRPDSSIDAYSLGIWLGDGSCGQARLSKQWKYGPNSKEQRMIIPKGGINITTADRCVIIQFDKAYPNECINANRKKGNLASSYRITTKGKFAKELIRLGLAGTNSETKFIPTECLLSSIQYRKRLLAGLIDTDGYVSKNGSVSIVTKSKRLAEDIKFLTFSLGGSANISEIKKSIKSINFIGTYYNVSISFKNLDMLSEVQVEKKRNRLLERASKKKDDRYYQPNHVAIKCIRTNPQFVYGIEIDSPSKLYITNDWMVTHNSMFMLELLKRLDPNSIKNDNVIYAFHSTSHLIKKIKDNKKTAIGIDELKRFFHYRMHSTTEQIVLTNLIEYARSNCLAFIGCCNDIRRINNNYRNAKVQMVIWLLDRYDDNEVGKSYGLVFVGNPALEEEDKFMMESFRNVYSFEQIRVIAENLPTFMGYVFVEDIKKVLTDEEIQAYYQKKQEGIRREAEKYEKKLEEKEKEKEVSVENMKSEEYAYYVIRQIEKETEDIEDTLERAKAIEVLTNQRIREDAKIALNKKIRELIVFEIKKKTKQMREDYLKQFSDFMKK